MTHGRSTVVWKHGTADQISAHGISCGGAGHVLKYALDHGIVRPRARPGSPVLLRDGYFVLVHHRMRGYRYGFVRGTMDSELSARDGRRRISFGVCWLNVDC